VCSLEKRVPGLVHLAILVHPQIHVVEVLEDFLVAGRLRRRSPLSLATECVTFVFVTTFEILRVCHDVTFCEQWTESVCQRPGKGEVTYYYQGYWPTLPTIRDAREVKAHENDHLMVRLFKVGMTSLSNWRDLMGKLPEGARIEVLFRHDMDSRREVGTRRIRPSTWALFFPTRVIAVRDVTEQVNR